MQGTHDSEVLTKGEATSCNFLERSSDDSGSDKVDSAMQGSHLVAKHLLFFWVGCSNYEPGSTLLVLLVIAVNHVSMRVKVPFNCFCITNFCFSVYDCFTPAILLRGFSDHMLRGAGLAGLVAQ